ncbi:hypothetical protein [Methylocella silvestris]|uniref:DUF4384 domain-containing protein n=1 Tax=Methylocella silvestris TaxID=199596 RepID=A0A2J7TJH6_METSI|nr:hypothetical protein [Methylocella silvestris]PNG26930.1 hypothetical protein CR492_06410 [Methylocella silvestris]
MRRASRLTGCKLSCCRISASALRRFAVVAALTLALPAQGGVRLLAPGDEMAPITSFRDARPDAPAAAKAPKLGTVRVAVEGGDARLVAGLAPYAAPFEVVASSAGPDLIFDPGAHQARSKGEVVAYDIDENDLPAVIDRTALAESLAKLMATRPQPIRLSGATTVRRKGDKVEVQLEDMRGRSLVLFAVNGNGAVQALYPIAADPRVINDAAFAWTFQIREPFGTDLIVAVSATQPLTEFERGLKELSHNRAAGQILQLISLAAPADARIGVVALSSAP